jgi:3-hydroxyacyl-CoA dehydrogenase
VRLRGEKFRLCPLLVKYVKAGRLGRKAERGVYEYDTDTHIRRAQPNRQDTARRIEGTSL